MIIIMLTYDRKTGLKIEPQNIAIPNSLINKVERQLTFAFYVQTEDGFLSKVQLESAVQASTLTYMSYMVLALHSSPQGGEVQYRCAGFLLLSMSKLIHKWSWIAFLIQVLYCRCHSLMTPLELVETLLR